MATKPPDTTTSPVKKAHTETVSAKIGLAMAGELRHRGIEWLSCQSSPPRPTTNGFQRSRGRVGLAPGKPMPGDSLRRLTCFNPNCSCPRIGI